MDEQTNGYKPINRVDIIYIFQAYNRKELTYDEFIAQTRAWSEAMRRQYGKDQARTEAIAD